MAYFTSVILPVILCLGATFLLFLVCLDSKRELALRVISGLMLGPVFYLIGLTIWLEPSEMSILAAGLALLAGIAIALQKVTPAPEALPERSLGDVEATRRTIMLFSVFNSLKDLVLVVNKHGMVVFMNQAAVDRLGDQVGMPCTDTIHCSADSCRLCAVRNPSDDALAGAPEISETNVGGHAYEVTRNRMRNDEDGRVILTARDVTERRMVQRQLVINEKMMSLGQLVAGVAHEINNPITFVFTNLELLSMMQKGISQYFERVRELVGALSTCDDENVAAMAREMGEFAEQTNLDASLEQLPAMIEDLEEGVRRVKKIVQDLKEFSHAGGSEPESTDLNAIVTQTLRVAHNELKNKATVNTELDGKLPPIMGLPQQLKQALLNLVVNAAQAVEGKDGGKVEIKSQRAGDSVRVIVSDNGVGISPELQEQIFEPFYTSKPVGKGTGLGLSVVYGIIKRHGGDIRVESKPDMGATFTIDLPIDGPRPEQSARPVSIYSTQV